MIEPDLSKGVDIREPHNGETIRCNPDPGSQVPAYVTKDEKTGKYYVIARDFLPKFEAEFPGRAKSVVLHMTMNTEGELFFWPIETEHDAAS